MKKRSNKTKIAVFGSLKALVICSLFVAISIVCGKYLAIKGGDILRFSFENLPIILTGIAFGPLAAAAVGIVADLLGCLLVGYAINPILTVGAAMIGIVSGLTYKLCKKMPQVLCVSLCVGISHLIGSVVIKTVGLSAFYSISLFELMLWRLLNYVIVGVLEGIIICIMLKNKALRTQLHIKREKRSDFDELQ